MHSPRHVRLWRRKKGERERVSFFCRATEKEGEKKMEGIGEGRKKKKNMNSGICAGCRKKIAFGKS